MKDLEEEQAAQATGAAGQAEERLAAACRKVAPGGAAHFDPGQQSSAVPVREPGTAVGAFSDSVSQARCREDVLRQSPLSGEIEPGR